MRRRHRCEFALTVLADGCYRRVSRRSVIRVMRCSRSSSAIVNATVSAMAPLWRPGGHFYLGAVSGGHRNGPGELSKNPVRTEEVRDATGAAADGGRAGRLAPADSGRRDICAGRRGGGVLDEIDPTLAGWCGRGQGAEQAPGLVATLVG